MGVWEVDEGTRIRVSHCKGWERSTKGTTRVGEDVQDVQITECAQVCVCMCERCCVGQVVCVRSTICVGGVA